MFNFWKNLSVVKKLYIVVGGMALLIALELGTLVFALTTLSSVRAFVGGEGLWSKAQKNAIHSLTSYIFTKDKTYYDDFHAHMQIPLGDRHARLELMKPHPDIKEVYAGFAQGGIHADDIPGVIRVLQRFGEISYIKAAVTAWTKADNLLDALIKKSEELRLLFSEPSIDQEKVKKILADINRLNAQLTEYETEFSSVLGEGSRWLENLLMVLLILAVATIEGTGLLLTFSFAKNLNRSLLELNHATSEIGKGNLGMTVPVHSRDELGQLAESINKMSHDLDANISKRLLAENANQVKTLFLANMSHEIRTPLGIILGMTEILKDPQVSEEEKRKYLDVIESTGHNLARLINDILDITKVESGHLEVEYEAVQLEGLMQEVDTMMALKAAKAGTALKFNLQDRLRKMEVATDRNRLKQILVNLINNAIKFTHDGQVQVDVGTIGQDIYFEVSDTGIGIPQSMQSSLFQNFFQADTSSTRKYEGTGLGLVLSRKLARSLGGDVVLKRSAPGEGSVFRLTIPQREVDQIPAKETEKLSEESKHFLRGFRVLIVDDSEDNQILIQHHLKKYGVVCDTASDGVQAIQKAQDNPFDVVLMDMQMPQMDGYSATRKLRENGYQKPIVALTAHAMKEDRDRCISVGCNDYLTKPIVSEQLYKTLLELTHSHPGNMVLSKAK
ncbi:response regulator [Bdellovibrio sp. SKB1291214]|uniref:response regulator n=1 Tax=Bdellovibrio sp. SKB1291214 TaxID=1732569 RepID=UPI0020CDB6B8|nr:response regulator [Bdellovibrio sp. SKB1291214]UYL07986.1 response regulator [Bdellovibrio sp. SKB1291214]